MISLYVVTIFFDIQHIYILGLWSGQKPLWNWYFTPMLNYGEVRGAQLANSSLLTSTFVPLGSFQIFQGLFRCWRVSGMRKATGSCRTYSSQVKLQPWFLTLRWNTCLWQNCSLGSSVCSKGPALGQNTDD